jgi:hypothetical protein
MHPTFGYMQLLNEHWNKPVLDLKFFAFFEFDRWRLCISDEDKNSNLNLIYSEKRLVAKIPINLGKYADYTDK